MRARGQGREQQRPLGMSARIKYPNGRQLSKKKVSQWGAERKMPPAGRVAPTGDCRGHRPRSALVGGAAEHLGSRK